MPAPNTYNGKPLHLRRYVNPVGSAKLPIGVNNIMTRFALADVSAEYEEAMRCFPMRRRGIFLHLIAASLFLPLLLPGFRSRSHRRSRRAGAGSRPGTA
jgi:hypothetical protein